MKKTLIFTIIFLSIFHNCIYCQDIYNWKNTYNSEKYPYSITIPQSFEKEKPVRKNIDQIFVDDYGASISVNVTQRQPEEFGITAHDYSKEYLENDIRQALPNYTITRSQKIIIDGQKAFLCEDIGGPSSLLKVMDCYIFYKDKVYLIMAVAPIPKFDNYRVLFEAAIKSFDFN